MGIEFLPDGRTLIKHHYRRNDGTATTIQKTIDTQNKRSVAKALLDLVAEVEGSFSDKTFKHLAAHYRIVRGVKGMDWHFNTAEEFLGKYRPNKKFAYEFDRVITRCKANGWAQNTIANIASVVQRVFNLAVADGLIESSPIRNFKIQRKFRDRVRTDEEKQRMNNVLAGNPLYWSVRFLEERPARGRSDLWNMTEENLVLVGPGAPYIKYKPSKTANRHQEYTYIPLKDVSPDILEYLVRGRPNGCRYLFPHVFKNGFFRHMGYPIKAWRSICKKAQISDFNIHDLKHEAITNMIRNLGYTTEMIKELGIQYSERSIEVYWNKSAIGVLQNIASKCENPEQKEAINV